MNADDHLTPINMKSFHYEDPPDLYMQWKSKPLHGRHPNEAEESTINNDFSNHWMNNGKLFPETEGFFISIQDQVVPTKNYRKYIIKDATLDNDRCRKCNINQETITHLLSGCPFLLQSSYKTRHDNVGKILYIELLKKYEFNMNPDPYYKLKPQGVLDNHEVSLYWDRTLITDITVTHNRPDILIHNKRDKTVTAIDIAIVNNNNISSTISTKISKYQNLMYQLKMQWNLSSTYVHPIIISTTALIPKATIDSMKKLKINPYIIDEMQKAVILDNCRLIREIID